MNIEMIGVDFVRLAIAKTDYLVPHINENDREPSWDGDVEVYRKAGDTHTKSDLILKVPVQVKGHKESNLKKQSITYPIELSDLRNYLNAGGTIFLVVYIDESGEKSQIYYNTLLPFELRRLVNKYGEQKTKSIKLKMLPTKQSAITDVFLFAATHMKKQRPAISCDPISMEDLMKAGCVPKFYLEYTAVPNSSTDPLDYMLEHDSYIYAKLPFGLELPVEHLTGITMAGTTFETPVRVNGHVFYSKYSIIQSKSILEYHFGKSTKLITDRSSGKSRLTFSETGTLSERITDVEFIIQAFETGHFEAGDKICPLNAIKPEERERVKIKDRKDHLALLQTVKALLDRLGVMDELDCDQVSAADEAMLKKLITSVLRGESVEWANPEDGFPDITVANLTIKLCVLKDKKKKGFCKIYGYSDAPIGVKIKNQTGQETDVSYHVFLKKDSMLKCCNIDYATILRQLKTVPTSSEYSGALVWFLLEMLCSYDESGETRQDILDGAIKLADWLRNTDTYTPQDLLDLNYYQSVKRSRALSAREIQGLHSIIESKPARKDVYVGAYLLLGDFASAQHYYDGMEEESQNVFKTYPICHFFPNTQ